MPPKIDKPDSRPPVKCQPPNDKGVECENLKPKPGDESGVSRFVTKYENVLIGIASVSLGLGFGLFAGVVAYAVKNRNGSVSNRQPANDNRSPVEAVDVEPVTQVRPIDPQRARVQRMAEKISGFDAMYGIGDYDRTARAERYLKQWEEFRAANRTSFLPSSRDGSAAPDLDFPPDRWIQSVAASEAREIVKLNAQVKRLDPSLDDKAAQAKAGELYERLAALPTITREALLHWDPNNVAQNDMKEADNREVFEAAINKAKQGLAHQGKNEPKGGAEAETDYRKALRQHYLDLEKAPDKEAFKATHTEPQRSELAKAYVTYRNEVRVMSHDLITAWYREPELAPESVRQKIVQGLRAETRLRSVAGTPGALGSVHQPAEGEIASDTWVVHAMSDVGAKPLEAGALQRVVRPESAEGIVHVLIGRKRGGGVYVERDSLAALRKIPWIAALPPDAREAAVSAIADRAIEIGRADRVSRGVALRMPEVIDAIRSKGLVVVDPNTGRTAHSGTTVPPPPSVPPPAPEAAEVTMSGELPAFRLEDDPSKGEEKGAKPRRPKLDFLTRARLEREARAAEATRVDQPKPVAEENAQENTKPDIPATKARMVDMKARVAEVRNVSIEGTKTVKRLTRPGE